MKKFLSLCLTAVLVLALLAGCSQNEPAANDQNNGSEPSAEKSLYKDGTYKATYSHVDGHGWRPELTITVKGGKITEAKMNYVNPDRALKSEDENYASRMKERSGVTPSEAFAKLNDELVSKQDPNKVDTVTGATHTTENFIELAKNALENAKKGVTSEVILPMNDTYSAADAEFDDHGWKAQIAVTYENGKIVKVEYSEINEEGQNKRDSADYAERMKAKSGTTPAEAQPLLEKALVESQDPDKVDVVTGATHTSHKFVELAKKAIAKRVEYKK